VWRSFSRLGVQNISSGRRGSLTSKLMVSPPMIKLYRRTSSIFRLSKRDFF
jgi:hypothetical protein